MVVLPKPNKGVGLDAGSWFSLSFDAAIDAAGMGFMVVLPKSVVSLVILGSLGLEGWPIGCVACPKLKTEAVLEVAAGAANIAGAFEAAFCTAVWDGAKLNAVVAVDCATAGVTVEATKETAPSLGPNDGKAVALGNSNDFTGSGTFAALIGTGAAGCTAAFG